MKKKLSHNISCELTKIEKTDPYRLILTRCDSDNSITVGIIYNTVA